MHVKLHGKCRLMGRIQCIDVQSHLINNWVNEFCATAPLYFWCWHNIQSCDIFLIWYKSIPRHQSLNLAPTFSPLQFSFLGNYKITRQISNDGENERMENSTWHQLKVNTKWTNSKRPYERHCKREKKKTTWTESPTEKFNTDNQLHERGKRHWVR